MVGYITILQEAKTKSGMWTDSPCHNIHTWLIVHIGHVFVDQSLTFTSSLRIVLQELLKLANTILDSPWSWSVAFMSKCQAAVFASHNDFIHAQRDQL